MTTAIREQRLESILHAYLQAIDRNEKPNRQAILDANPDLRKELAEYFDDASKLDRMAKSLRTASFAGGASEASPAPGKIRYFGDYELLEEIARGGMGVVYQAKQTSLQRIVALKMILKGELASEADVRRFRQEAEAAANLDHPNIVPIYEVGEHEGQQYFSMKRIETEPRSSGSGIPPCADTTARTFTVAARLAKVARAVHHAHQRGILHRDLKPSNILIDKNGEPHVADFGLAKQMASTGRECGVDATKPGVIVGTPAYMAPEQARTEKTLTTAVDVYSLGAILYEWLTGRPPFRGDDAVSTLMKVVTDEPVPPHIVNPMIDRDLETICLKCLEKAPAKRYRDAEALAEDLELWSRGEPITARPATGRERLVKWARRKPAVAAFASFALLFGISFLVLTIFSYVEINRSLNAETTAKNEAVEAANRATIREREAVDAKRRESEERTRAEKDRDAAESLRLVAEANNASPRDPALGLLLSLQAADKTPERQVLHNNALLAGWQQCFELAAYTDPKLLPLEKFQSHVSFTNVAVSSDGKLLATITDRLLWEGGAAGFGDRLLKKAHMYQTVQIRDARSGTVRAVVHIPGMNFRQARFSPDGKTLATICEGMHTSYPEPKDKSRLIQGVRFTDWTVRLWDAATGKEKHVLKGHLGRVVTLDFSPDGKLVATGSWDHTVRIWKVASGESLHVLQTEKLSILGGLGVAVTHVQFSPDGSRLLTLTDGCRTSVAGSLPYLKDWLPKMDPRADALGEIAWVNRAPIEQGFNGPYRYEGDDRTPAQVWDSATGKLIATLRPKDKAVPTEPTTWAGFAPSGEVLTGHWRGSLNRWTSNGEFQEHWKASDSSKLGEGPAAPIEGVAFHADGKRLLVIHSAVGPFEQHTRTEVHHRASIALRDAKTGKVLNHWTEPETLRLLRVSPNGEFLLTLKSNTKEPDAAREFLEIRLAATGDVIAELRGHAQTITAAEFLPGSPEIVSSSLDGTVRRWRADGAPHGSPILRHEMRKIAGVAVHPNGGQAVSFAHPLQQGGAVSEPNPSERGVRVWKLPNGEALANLSGYSDLDARLKDYLLGDVTYAEYAQSGESLVTVSRDWILGEGPKAAQAQYAYTPVRVWDTKTLKLRYALEGISSEIRSASFSPDGRWLLTVSARVRHVRDLKLEDKLLTSIGITGNQPKSEPAVRLWDAANGKLVRILQDEKLRCFAALWNPDGTKVLISSAPNDPNNLGDYPSLALYDPSSGKILTRCDTSQDDSWKVHFSPDGRWIVGINGTRLPIWDASTGKHVRTLKDHTGDVTAVAFSRNGRLVASAAHDRTARIWHAETGELLHTLTGHGGKLTAIAFSPDGQWIATASEDATARLWNPATGRLWMTSAGHRGPVRVLTFTPDSRILFTGSEDAVVRSCPIDPLSAACAAKPRDWTDEERDWFQIPILKR